MFWMCRSREGAWIEIPQSGGANLVSTVAPVRERGLKSVLNEEFIQDKRRSREGAWIEIN